MSLLSRPLPAYIHTIISQHFTPTSEQFLVFNCLLSSPKSISMLFPKPPLWFTWTDHSTALLFFKTYLEKKNINSFFTMLGQLSSCLLPAMWPQINQLTNSALPLPRATCPHPSHLSAKLQQHEHTLCQASLFAPLPHQATSPSHSVRYATTIDMIWLRLKSFSPQNWF